MYFASFGYLMQRKIQVRLHLGTTFVSAFMFFCFFFFFTRLWDLRLLFMHCVWTVVTKFDFSFIFQPINAHHALFMDPQISLFSNFFIKNGSHCIIYTFKNYFVTVFFSFQFLTVSKRTLNVECFLWLTENKHQ